MLILTRKIGESILVGDNIVVEIRDIRPGRVSVGIAAPSEVCVLREEVKCGPRKKTFGGKGKTAKPGI